MMIGIGIPNNHNKIGIAYLQNLCVILFRLPGTRDKRRSFQVPSRNCPPSTAARLAANAPNSSAAVIQKASLAAPRRA